MQGDNQSNLELIENLTTANQILREGLEATLKAIDMANAVMDSLQRELNDTKAELFSLQAAWKLTVE